jgi:ribokinase
MSGMDIKVLTIGAATQDVFLTGKIFTARRDVREQSYVEQFPLGAKLNVEQVYFDTGGGASNAAVTFARQGFKTGFVGKVAHDPAGVEVMRVLHKEGVATEHVAYDAKLATGYSVLLLAPNGERTVLNYRGASHELQGRDVKIRSLAADWFYISSLAGNLRLLKELLSHAGRNGIKVAYNPGGLELSQGRKLRKLLPMVEVLCSNREELTQLYPGDDERTVLQQAAAHSHIVVMTDGPRGTWATDGAQLYQAGQYHKVKVIDRTGAGDAFGSGFVAGLAKGMGIDYAISLGSANSTSVVTKIGAKTGILRTDRIKKMKIKVTDL